MFPLIRFSRSLALLLMVALVVSAGCQIFSPKPSPPTPVVPLSPAPPVVNVPSFSPSPSEQVPYSAFRPIMPEQSPAPASVPAAPVAVAPATSASLSESSNEPPRIAPDTAAQSKIEELTQKITELEAQIAEAKQKPPTIVVLNEPDALQMTSRGIAEEKRLPIINKQGVTVYSDELRRIRIAVMDSSLFTPNTWQLSAEGEETLRAIAAEIGTYYPDVEVDIEGHTDNLMSDPNNRMQKHDISSTKAKEVLDFFVHTLQWDVARMGTSSFGRSRPVADNGTPEGRAKNNRVEIVLRSRNE